MKTGILATLLLITLVGCSDRRESTAGAAIDKPPAVDVTAGKAIAERDCKACHGLDGKGAAPGIPNVAAQRDRYLLASLKEYTEAKRVHAALIDMTANMSEADMRNVVAYYAGLPPIAGVAGKDLKVSSPYEDGKALAATCTKCHGEAGNSRTPGMPSLAGQQPHYLVAAIQEYHQGERKTAPMKSMLTGSDRLQLEKLALYFASQTPAQRPPPAFGNPEAGKVTITFCGGCHGSDGVSRDASTPSLAGQDPQYLVKAIKAYRTTRQHGGVHRYVAGLSNQDIVDIAAFYAIQKPLAADNVPSSTPELAQKCNRCHDADNATVTAPKMRGQDKDYLVMALRAYRDGKRESSTMHNMSSIYRNALIDTIATWYAGQPAK
jgi:cytochrome c553